MWTFRLAALCVLALAVDGQEPPLPGLEVDDECAADAQCALNALQRRAARGADGVALEVVNNATNAVVLTNCKTEDLQAAPGKVLKASLPITGGGFFVHPEGKTVNCSTGCADCFYVALGFSEDNKSRYVHLGYGLAQADLAADENASDAMEVKGGGVELWVSSHHVRTCGHEACKDGWTLASPVGSDDEVRLVVQAGSAAAGGHGELKASAMVSSGYYPVVRRPYYGHTVTHVVHHPVYGHHTVHHVVHHPTGHVTHHVVHHTPYGSTHSVHHYYR